MVSIPGVSDLIGSVNWFGALGKVMYYGIYSFLGIAILGVFVFIWYVMQFKYKAIIRVMGSENSDGTRNIREVKIDKMREIKKSGMVVKWQLFKLRKKIQPLDYKFIFPGKYIFLDQYGIDTFVPTPFEELKNINVTSQTIKLWEQMEIKEAAEDYVNKQGFSKYKDFAIALITVIVCAIALGVTAYFCYKMVAMGRADAATIADALKNFQPINFPTAPQ